MEFLLGLAAISVLWGVVSSIAMVSLCSNRGVKIKWAFIRLFILDYISQYRKITLKENGKAGFWFYSFIVSMNTALLLVVIGFLNWV
jgi:hypothetical protein